MPLIERVLVPGEPDRTAAILIEKVRTIEGILYFVHGDLPSLEAPDRAFSSDKKFGRRSPASRGGARSKPSRLGFRGNSRARTKCPYQAGSVARRQEVARSTAPRARAAHVRAQTERRRLLLLAPAQ